MHYWRTSEASETLSGVTQLKIVVVCRRASETVLGADNAKSGICYWRASVVASETVLGVDNAKSGICYMYICMWDGTYAL